MRSTTDTPLLAASLQTSRLLGVALGALLLAVPLAGCQPDRGPGSVVIDYKLGNNKTCEEVGVQEIRGAVFKGTWGEPSVLFSDTVPCTDGEVVLEGVEPNIYEVRVIGYDQDGVATFDNLGQIAADRRVEVFEAAESSISVETTARPAELLVRWRLGQGGFANCTGVGIDSFEITAYQVGGGTLLHRVTLPCELPGDSQGYREIEDPDRSLNGALLGDVGIQAYAANGEEVGSPALFVFDPPGPGYSVELTVECTETGCVPE